MAVDLFRSRRGNFLRCEYYKRDISHKGDNASLIHKKKPDGIFYAKITGDKTQDAQNVAGYWNITSNQITLETEDIINVVVKDLVKVNEEIWLVERLSDSPLMKNYEFGRKASKKTILTLRKGE